MTLIQFDIESGARIAAVVGAIESIPNRRRPLNYDPIFEENQQKVFRVCTFTGAWAINTSKTVTFKNQTTTPNTVSATNLFFPIDKPPISQRDCAIAKDGPAWYLIDVPLRTATASFVTDTASVSLVKDFDVSASFNTSSCSITLTKTKTQTSVIVISQMRTDSYLQIDL